MIYSKALKLSSLTITSGKQTVGQIMNHMTMDSSFLMWLFFFIHYIWATPVQVDILVLLCTLHTCMGNPCTGWFFIHYIWATPVQVDILVLLCTLYTCMGNTCIGWFFIHYIWTTPVQVDISVLLCTLHMGNACTGWFFVHYIWATLVQVGSLYITYGQHLYRLILCTLYMGSTCTGWFFVHYIWATSVQVDILKKQIKWIFNIGLKRGFPCINICQVLREVLKTEGEDRDF